MYNKIWGNMIYKTGFKTKTVLSFLNKKWDITVKIQAYKEADGIAPAQENMCETFEQNKIQLLQDAENALLQEYPMATNRYVPQDLLFQRNGTCALLLSNKDEPDNGLAIQLLPNIRILSQDDYL